MVLGRLKDLLNTGFFFNFFSLKITKLFRNA